MGGPLIARVLVDANVFYTRTVRDWLGLMYTTSEAEPFLVSVEYDGQTSGKTAHAHEGQEFDYLLEGRMMVELDGNKVYLEPGDSIYYDSSLPHAMYALEADAKFIAVVIK